MTLLPPMLPYSTPPQTKTASSRRDRRGMLIAWLVILVTVGAVGINVYRSSASRLERARQGNLADDGKLVNPQLVIVVKYAVGARELTGISPPGMTEQLLQAAGSRAERLAIIPALAELSGPDAALAALNKLDQSIPPTTAPAAQPATSPGTQPSLALPTNPSAAQLLAHVYLNGPTSLEPSHRQRLVDQLGWSGRLALSFGDPPDDADRRAVLQQARTVAVLLLVFGIGAFAAVAIGFVLLIVAIVFFAQGNVVLRYRQLLAPAWPRTGPFVEAFAIYLCGQVALSTLISAISPEKSIMWTFLSLAPVLFAMCWPRIRGVRGLDFRIGFGWIAPQGFWREVGSGIVGYLAGLPIFVLGIIISMLLIKVSESSPSHPVVHEAGEGGLLGTVMLFVLASVFAPIVEETFFRGALFHHLRSWCGWILSALISSVIFAAVHPQGWTLIPGLASLAIVFCAIREWRGSNIGGMVAHALHNGALVTLLVVAM